MALDDQVNEQALVGDEAETARALEEQGDEFFKEEDETGSTESAAGDKETGDDQAAKGDDNASDDSATDAQAAADAQAAGDAQDGDDGKGDDTADDDTVDDGAAQNEHAAKQSEPFAPQLKVEKSADEYKQEIATLDEQFDKGEIEAADYRVQVRELERAAIKAEMAEDTNTQTAEQRWDYSQQQFYNQGDNAIFRDNPVMRGALGAALEGLYGVEENTGKGDLWFLTEAAKQVRDQMGMSGAEGGDAGEQEAPEPTPGNTGRGKHDEIPQTLGDAPTSEANDSGGEFAHLDSLSGIEHEKAFAQLSPAQQDRYLAET